MENDGDFPNQKIREIKKFVPYKKILESYSSPSPKVQGKGSTESSETQKQVPKTQDLHSDEMPPVKKLKLSRKSKSEKRSKSSEMEPISRLALIEESSTSGEDKHDKENSTLQKDVIHVEDSNDANDCVIVLDGNGNNVNKSSSQSQTVSSSLKQKESASPGKSSSNPLGSTRVFNFSQKLSRSINKTYSPKKGHKKTSRFKKSKQNPWDSLFNSVNVLPDDKDKTKSDINQSDCKSKSSLIPPVLRSQEPHTSSVQFVNQVECSTSSTTTHKSEISTSSLSDLTSHTSVKPSFKSGCLNQTRTSTKSQPSQSNCSEKIDKICSLLGPLPKKAQETQCSTKLDDSVCITLDETIVSDRMLVPPGLESSVLNSSEVVIIDSTDCKSSSQVSTGPSGDESVIIDLEMITPAGSKPSTRTNDSAPLIVFDAMPKASASTSERYGICTAPDMIPLRSKRKHKSKRKEGKRPRAAGRRLSESERHKLTIIRNFVPESSGAVCGSRMPLLAGPSRGYLPRQPVTNQAPRQPVTRREDTNIYNPAGESSSAKRSGLRPIVIDGCNVAMEHGKVSGGGGGTQFSAQGIRIMVDYFKQRGHAQIHVFVPHHKAHQYGTTNQEILERLKNEGILTLTPSRVVDGHLQAAYDDRYVVQTAAELGGVIVSNDRYRDLMRENDKWKAAIEQRLLMFNFVNDLLMFPQDPLGRDGPTLDQLLRFPPD